MVNPIESKKLINPIPTMVLGMEEVLEKAEKGQLQLQWISEEKDDEDCQELANELDDCIYALWYTPQSTILGTSEFRCWLRKKSDERTKVLNC